MLTGKIVLLGFAALVLAGCAMTSRYDGYTKQHFAAKDQYFNVNIYSQSQPLRADKPYYVIGKVSVEGFASDGVTPQTLTDRAKRIARLKGADAIINVKTEEFRYYNGDTLLRFLGELIVFAPGK